MKYNWQLHAINTFSKIGLIASLMIINGNYFSTGFYHFISLYGVLCFLISLYFEYKRLNLILCFFSILGIIAYQPFYSVLKYDVFEGEVRTNELVLQVTLLAGLPWIIFDVVRWIKDFKKNKNSQPETLSEIGSEL